jgi:hypothetical protein
MSHHKKSIVKGGVIRSKNDHRDYIAEGIFHEQRLAGSSVNGNEKVPSKLFLFDDETSLKVGGNSVYNQGATFKCVAYVVCTIRESQVYREGVGGTSSPLTPPGGQAPLTPYIDDNSTTNTDNYNYNDNSGGLRGPRAPYCFSKDYIYDLRENAFSDGMSGSNAMQIVVTHGCIEEREHDHYLELYNKIARLERQKRDQGDDDHSEIDEAQDEMNQLIYRMKQDPSKRGNQDVYAKVTTVQGLKQSLLHNGPCLIILPFYGNPHSTTFWVPPTENATDEMGHAVTVMGYDDDEQSFYVRNTWGPNWNVTGHFWFPYSHLKLAWEIWTIFPRGTDKLVYHKKRVAGASISPTSLSDSSNTITIDKSVLSTLLGVKKDDLGHLLSNNIAGSFDKKRKEQKDEEKKEEHKQKDSHQQQLLQKLLLFSSSFKQNPKEKVEKPKDKKPRTKKITLLSNESEEEKDLKKAKKILKKLKSKLVN